MVTNSPPGGDPLHSATMSSPVEVRDPVHGAIPISKEELRVLDHPLVQRLRHIRQLGFSDLSFPGATHTRYLHSIGAMHLAGRAFDAVFAAPGAPSISPGRKDDLRRVVRLAALLHDVGHAPFSHASEFAMPARSALGLPTFGAPEKDRQATHEDYTLKILLDSSLSPVLEASAGLPAAAVAALVDADLPWDREWYRVGEIDFRPLFQQLISSELDVDRMDYLQRDSHFAGVQYGVFDAGWILNNLRSHVVEGRAHLAFHQRAIYAFDDFLIARYHMFLMVYFHYRSVAYEEMLKRWIRGGGADYTIPSDIEKYAEIDDIQLTAILRASPDEWARRIVERREFKLLLERHGEEDRRELTRVAATLEEGGIHVLRAESKGVLSKYVHKRRHLAMSQRTLPLPGIEGPPPIFVVVEPWRGSQELRAKTLEESTDLFDRYQGPLHLSRLYVRVEDVDRAGRVLVDSGIR